MQRIGTDVKKDICIGATGPVGKIGLVGMTGATGPIGECKCPSLDILDAKYARLDTLAIEEHVRPIRIIPDDPLPCHAIINIKPGLTIVDNGNMLTYESHVALSGCNVDESTIELAQSGIYAISMQFCVSNCIPGATIHLSIDGEHVAMDPSNMMLTIPTNRFIMGCAFMRINAPNAQFRISFNVEGRVIIDTGMIHISTIA
jgi:hypothetical protein